MKRYTTKVLKSAACIYMAFPATYLISVAILFDISAGSCLSIVLSPFFIGLSILAMITGYGLWEMRRWAWYFLFVVNALIAFENAKLVHAYGETHHKVLAYIASLLLLSGLMHRISREIRVPYFFPKIRWWESNPRYRLSVPVRLERRGLSAGSALEASSVVDGEILDLSMGGCFVKLRTELRQDELLDIKFTVFSVPMTCQGIVVWRTQSTVTHPKGVGVKFSLPSRPQKRMLRQITARLRKIAALYRRSRYLLTPEEFGKRLDELENKHIQDTA